MRLVFICLSPVCVGFCWFVSVDIFLLFWLWQCVPHHGVALDPLCIGFGITHRKIHWLAAYHHSRYKRNPGTWLQTFPGFRVVASFAQWLPILPIPK